MSTRRIILAVTVILLLGAGGLVWWTIRPTPFRAVYDRVQLGQAEADVDPLLLALTERPFEGGYLVRFVWQGAVDGEHHRVQVDGVAGDDSTPSW